MPCGTCSLDGVTIVCALDQRCSAGLFCTITNHNQDHAVVVTVRQSFQPFSNPVTSTVTLPAGGSEDLGCDSFGLGQTTTFDITGVQRITEGLTAFQSALAAAGAPANIAQAELQQGFFVWATDANGNAIALTFVPKP